MFPIRNIGGKTVGFSGRILPQLVDATQAQGKYVNTPETSVYHKSKILFGYDTAKKKMMETKEVIVVEGQMDLCMSYQAGIHNTIAVSGTAFTDEHIKLIKRFADKVILSFDSDNAGITALKKSAKLCLYGGLDVYALHLSTKDPADLIKENTEAWKDVIEKREQVILFLLHRLQQSVSDEREIRKKIKEEILPLVGAVVSPLDRDYFLTKISEETKIDKKTLESETVLEKGEQEEVQVKNEIVIKEIKRKEEILLTLATLVTWKQLQNHELALPYKEDIESIPKDIIEKEIFRLSLKMEDGKGVENMLRDLVLEYQKEIILVQIEEVKKEMLVSLDDETLLQKLQILTKQKEALHKK
jgi:DNA primase